MKRLETITGSARRVPAPADRGATDWRTLSIVGIVLMVTQLGFFLTSAALPLYLHDLGAAESRIGLEVGLGNMTALLLTLVLGPAINRFGARVFLSLGASIYLVTSLAMLFVPHEAPVTFFRALQGIGTATIMPSAFTLGARVMPRRHGTSIAMLGALNTLMLAVGPPLGLSLYSSHGAIWLFLPAAAAAALGLISTIFIPAVEREARPASGFGFDRIWIPSLLTNTLSVLYFGGILAYLPLYLRQVHGPNAGIFFTADALGVLLLRIPTGMLADRSGSLLPKLLGISLTLPGIALLALAPSTLTLIASGAATGVGAGLSVTGIMTDLSRLSNAGNRGTAMSLGGGSFSAGIFVGSSVSGLLIGPGGFNAVLLFGVLTCAASLPFAVRGVPPAWEAKGGGS